MTSPTRVLVRDRRHRRSRRADRRLARPRRRGRRHPRLAGGSRVARPRVERPRGQRARPRDGHRPAVAGRPRARDERGVVDADRGLRGLYNSATDEIKISEDLDEQIIVHEAAHAWFNGGAVPGALDQRGPGRRIRVAHHRGRGPGRSPGPTPSPADRQGGLRPQRLAAAVPRRRDDERPTRQYGYDASWTVIRAIVDDVGRGEDA